jgi:hypothetical protein
MTPTQPQEGNNISEQQIRELVEAVKYAAEWSTSNPIRKKCQAALQSLSTQGEPHRIVSKCCCAPTNEVEGTNGDCTTCSKCGKPCDTAIVAQGEPKEEGESEQIARDAIDHMFKELDMDIYGVDLVAAWEQAKSEYLNSLKEQNLTTNDKT